MSIFTKKKEEAEGNSELSYEDKLAIEAEIGNLAPEQVDTCRRIDAAFARRGVSRRFLEPVDQFFARACGEMKYAPRPEDL